ncbi:hypothetical protein BD289DRAFT_167831 [Coniella lustricola]|uniref:LysM domain-containing protein n=1 Tax=Coniella lustricola TaxID=2025994 RepID=A0A2T2ZU27_9PEZI|nr:hypothetical protein BD289DRAFT_167831 [Coniella lustricola]
MLEARGCNATRLFSTRNIRSGLLLTHQQPAHTRGRADRGPRTCSFAGNSPVAQPYPGPLGPLKWIFWGSIETLGCRVVVLRQQHEAIHRQPSPKSHPIHAFGLPARRANINANATRNISLTTVTMPRRYDYDSDQERLPEGMVRVGYDADTQVYTFRDVDGSLWEGPPGCQYGHMTKVANGPKPPSDLTNIDVETAGADTASHDEQPPSYDESEATVPFLSNLGTHTGTHRATSRWGDSFGMAKHWRAEMMPLLNFFMILALFLVGLFWFLGWATSSKSLAHCDTGSHAHQIQKGESCWSIAQMHGIDVDRLKQANHHLDCDLLRIGGLVCVPAMPMANPQDNTP